MAKIKKGELFGHLSGFLKSKGIDLRRGSYTRRIQQGCTVLSDTINLSQDALTRARNEMDKGLTRMRELIHRKKSPPRPTGQARSKAKASRSKPKRGKTTPKKSAKAKARTR